MSMWSSLGFQDGSSVSMEQLIFFHDYTMVVLILVLSLVGYMMMGALRGVHSNRSLLENQILELIWTILPAGVLLFIAFPSLRLLYLMDETELPGVTLKVIGHQWYWSYEYSDFKEVEFDSYMVGEEELSDFMFRNLEVDSHGVVPFNTQLRVVVTAADVIHSWALPAAGVKVDAVPGRLNQLSLNLSRPGLWFGQCSEICGANHSFMPIVLESVSFNGFVKWLNNF